MKRVLNKIKYLVIGALFCGWITPVSAQTKAENTTLSTTQLQKDFKVFRRVLEEIHAGIYWYSSKAEMNQQFDEVAQSLNKPMTEQAFFQKLASITAKIKCGHTWIASSKALKKHLWKNHKLIPMQIKVIQNHLPDLLIKLTRYNEIREPKNARQ